MDRTAHVMTAPPPSAEQTAMNVLLALSISHMLNDIIQAVVPSVYPLLKTSFALSFTQIGLITLVYQGTASILQPLVGSYTDRRPMPYSLVLGMSLTLVGLALIAFAWSYGVILVAAALIGTGSAIFHPEASRLARLASGGKHGLAQSLFQVGGNLGTSLGPLLAAAIVMPRGQIHILWFGVLAVVALVILSRLSAWYRRHLTRPARAAVASVKARLSRRQIGGAMAVLVALLFSKYIYLVTFTNYYTFYLIDRFGLTAAGSQIYLFLFLFAVAAGTIIGGPVGDRIGRKRVIWASILGVAPFALVIPHVGLAATAVLTVIIGVILASAFSAMLVYAQELVPGKVGMIAGLFFGLAFGIAGIGSALLGMLADHTSIQQVFAIVSFLPLIGLLAGLLPDVEVTRRA
jgi:FSR family fosmidomycin resistance protein-like MFS transporter